MLTIDVKMTLSTLETVTCFTKGSGHFPPHDRNKNESYFSLFILVKYFKKNKL